MAVEAAVIYTCIYLNPVVRHIPAKLHGILPSQLPPPSSPSQVPEELRQKGEQRRKQRGRKGTL